MSRISDKLAAAAIRKATNTNPDHALIKQMGEALIEAIRMFDAAGYEMQRRPSAKLFGAEAAYNHWKKGQS